MFGRIELFDTYLKDGTHWYEADKVVNTVPDEDGHIPTVPDYYNLEFQRNRAEWHDVHAEDEARIANNWDEQVAMELDARNGITYSTQFQTYMSYQRAFSGYYDEWQKYRNSGTPSAFDRLVLSIPN